MGVKTVNNNSKEFYQSAVYLTLPQILFKQAERLEGETALRAKAYGIWQTYSWSEYASYARYAALGLKTLGLNRGENLGLILDNDPEWLFSELGGQAVGAVTLNLFTSAVTKELIYGLEKVQAAFVIVQDQEQVDKLLESRDSLDFIKKVIYVDPTGMRHYQGNSWLISFKELLGLGQQLEKEQPNLFQTELVIGKPDEIALMIMTSGTTGKPKMVMLSHANLTSMAQAWLDTAPIEKGDNWMSISPPAWIVDQMWGVGITLTGGLIMNFPETFETVVEDFREIGPSIIITSSRFWEDLASKIRVKISNSGALKRAFYRFSQRIGTAYAVCESDGRKPSPYLRFLKQIAHIVVSRPLLDRVGCLNFKSAYTGGHPISPEVIRFFRINGLNLKQCYGMTETGGIFQVQPDGEVKPETVGKPLPGTQVKIDDDQEILVSGGSIFKGYYQNPEASAEAVRDGWFYTGDAGYIDGDGHLVILGRKQDIMRTHEGEVFSPDFVETRLKFSPYIKEAVIWGEGEAFLSAFINIDFDNVGNWAEDRKIPYTTYADLSRQVEVEELIRKEVVEVNATLPEAMKLAKIMLLNKLLDADDEELTRTGKVRRKFVFQRYQEMIEAFYSDQTELAVKGQVHYRDGTVGVVESVVKIISITQLHAREAQR